MREVLIVIAVLLVGFGTGVSDVRGQQATIEHLVGTSISSRFATNSSNIPGGAINETVTLSFGGGSVPDANATNDHPAYTIDFVTRLSGSLTVLQPSAPVDVIVTQHAISDEKPAMAIRLYDRSLALPARSHGEIQGRQGSGG